MTTVGFDLATFLSPIRRVWPQVNLEKTKVISTRQHDFALALETPNVITSTYDEITRNKGIKAWGCRILGEILGLKPLIDKGFSVRHVPAVLETMRIIQVKAYTFSSFSTTLFFQAGYDALTDTLFASPEIQVVTLEELCERSA